MTRRAAVRLKRRARARLCAISTILVMLAGSAAAQSEEKALLSAFDVCTDIPDDIDTAREILNQAGWESAKGALVTVVQNAVFSFNFDAHDLEYTSGNAGFMAASILGNSGLGQDQIGVQSGDLKLALLGLPEGTPYCVFTGPETLLETLNKTGEFDMTMRQVSSVLLQGMGRFREQFIVGLARFEISELEVVLSKSSLPKAKANRILDLIAPVTVQIISPEIIQ